MNEKKHFPFFDMVSIAIPKLQVVSITADSSFIE